MSPAWVGIWLTNFPPFQIDIRLFHNFFLVSIPHVSSLIASPPSNVSCPILARHSSVCCPIPTQPGHPAVRPYLSRMFCRTYSLFARLPLANSSVCWIVGPCGVLFCCRIPRTANTQIQELQIPSIITFQTSHTAWSSLHQLASTAGIHLCGQACRQKLLTSVSYSMWLHPLNGFVPCTRLQMAQLLQCSPCTG